MKNSKTCHSDVFYLNINLKSLSDVNRGDILDLIDRNVQRNKELCKAPSHIKEIDFFDLRSITDLGTLIDDVTILLAADGEHFILVLIL